MMGISLGTLEPDRARGEFQIISTGTCWRRGENSWTNRPSQSLAPKLRPDPALEPEDSAQTSFSQLRVMSLRAARRSESYGPMTPRYVGSHDHIYLCVQTSSDTLDAVNSSGGLSLASVTACSAPVVVSPWDSAAPDWPSLRFSCAHLSFGLLYER